MSIIKGFSKLSREEKIEYIQKDISSTADILSTTNRYTHSEEQEKFDNFSENTLSNYYLPYGVAPNFLIDGKFYTVPMVIEESSVVAAAARAASFWANQGGFKTTIHNTIKVGHIWFEWNGEKSDLDTHSENIKKHLLESVKELTENMIKRGGGIVDILFIPLKEMPDIWQLQVKFQTADSMGANFINSCLEAMKEPLSTYFEDNNLSLIEVIMAILSNNTPECLVTCEASCEVDALLPYSANLSPEEFARRFVLAMNIAYNNIDRATTHNKGIYNGVDAVILATGNDFRAVEAAGHAFAAKDGQYRSLSKAKISNGKLNISLTIPLAIGTVGGLTRLHPLAALTMEILENPSAEDLMSIAAAAGLANNFSAVASLVTTGIQKGHMKLHLSNILTTLNATENQKIEAEKYFKDKTVSMKNVRDFLKI